MKTTVLIAMIFLVSGCASIEEKCHGDQQCVEREEAKQERIAASLGQFGNSYAAQQNAQSLQYQAEAARHFDAANSYKPPVVCQYEPITRVTRCR